MKSSTDKSNDPSQSLPERKETRCVLWSGLDPEIDILREAWLGVEGDGEAADDEGFKPCGR